MSSTHKAYLVQGPAVTIDPEPVCACRKGRAPELLEMPLGTLKTRSWIQDSCQTWVPTLPYWCDSDKRLRSTPLPPPPHTLCTSGAQESMASSFHYWLLLSGLGIYILWD